MAPFLRAVLASALFLALGASPGFAQLDRGQIAGFVKDQTGGVIPGATVVATSVQTGLSRTVFTDERGYFVFPSLPPDKYDLGIELQGFKKWVKSSVTLDASANLAVDAMLDTGTLSETVTVVAKSTPLQTDVALRKTVEAKDIELLSFSGRNPIGVVGLKAGVSGGAFNSRTFNDLGNGSFNINGSRADENNISIDGAIAVRTRSTGAIIGIQNVDAVQEVQVLTGNYMPEYGRASGGQIRFVTKSGSNRYTGSASFFLRDDSLQANTWARNRSTNPAESSGAAPFNYKQYGYAVGGPMPIRQLKNRFFFFGAQEFVDYFAISSNTLTVPTEAMRRGDFSELLNPNNGFFNGIRVINDPLTGQPFPNNVIPASRLSPNGLALLNAYPAPTPGFRQGTANLIISSENPQDQRKDTIRLDYRLNDAHQVTYRYSGYSWVAVDPFRPNNATGFPFARTDWDRPNATQVAQWTGVLRNNLVTELNYSYSLDEVFINVFTDPGLHKRSRTGINYPYIFPGKEIDDKLPTISIAGFGEIDGGPYPAFSRGPIHAFSSNTSLVKGRHTIKGGVVLEYSGEDDFDQINVAAIPGGTNNQNGRFEFLDNRPSGTGLGVANVALGLFSNYAEIGQRALTKWRALATDVFIQDSWKPASKLTIEGGVRWAFWPPWYSTTNNIANFDPRYYDRSRAAVINPATGRLVGGDRFNGVVLPGSGFEGEGTSLQVAADPRVQALFRGVPRGFSETHRNALEPRLGLSYSVNDRTIARVSAGVFHNRVALNDSTLLGGNPPFQPMVTVANGIVDTPAGGTSAATDLPFGMTAQDPVFKHPTSYMFSAGVQREVPLGFVIDASYVGRRGLHLQRELNINQLLPGTIQANPTVNIAALRPYLGYGAIRLSENSGRSVYHSMQISAERRYSNGFRLGVAYTLSKSEDDGSNKRDVVFNTYDDSNFWGPSIYDRRHVLGVSYIYDIPFWRQQDTALKNLLGGWQISGASFFRTGTPFSVLRTNDIAGVGDGAFGQPYNLVGNPKSTGGQGFSSGSDDVFWFNPAAFAAPAAGTFGNAPRNLLTNPGQQQWDIALFKNFRLAGSRTMQFRAEIFNFPNHPNLGNAQTNTLSGSGSGYADPTNASFGRVVTKTDDRRDIQLSLRFLF